MAQRGRFHREAAVVVRVTPMPEVMLRVRRGAQQVPQAVVSVEPELLREPTQTRRVTMVVAVPAQGSLATEAQGLLEK
jgi:hypothetical protein